MSLPKRCHYRGLHRSAFITHLCCQQQQQQDILMSLCNVSDFLSNFNKLWSFPTDFHESPQFQISRKSVQWELLWYLQIDGRTDGHT